MKQASSQVDWSYRVLIAEDCPDTKLILRVRLGEVATELACTSNGEECLDVARNAWRQARPFDLILVDLLMPRMDGFSVTKALRSEGYSLPILVMSARDLPDDRGEAIAAGCDQYLSKTFMQTRFRKPRGDRFDLLDPGVASLAREETDQVRGFVRLLPQILNRLSSSLEHSDFGRMRSQALRLKAAILFGFPKLGELGHRLAASAEEGSHERCSALIEEARACCGLVQAAFV